ncbi:MAG: EAL domain-containing protein [Casimicrobiaceae bacterium]|nr:EAL domain-containing protein [Casimicrobiaceae bacterium]MDW8312067.1 EAL domain-containing protein [Burkholderiales bacterium]
MSATSPEPPASVDLSTWLVELDPGEASRVLALMPAPVACFSWPEGVCLYCNAAYAALIGDQVNDLLGRTFAELWGHHAAASIRTTFERAIELGTPVRYPAAEERDEVQRPHPGAQIVANRRYGDRLYVLPAMPERDEPLREPLRSRVRRLLEFFDSSTAALAIIRSGHLVDANPRFAEWVGYSPSELHGAPIDRLLVTSDPTDAITTGIRFLRHRDGRHLQVEIVAHDMSFDDQPEQLLLVASIEDQPRSAEQLRHLALHDPLTGLPNRAHLAQYMRASIAAAEAHGHRFAVVFLDIDRFKRVNDSLGHAVGDELLLEYARRLRDFCAQYARQSLQLWVARVGGDEFVLFIPLPDHQTEERLASMVEELRALITQPMRLGDREVSASASIGVAIYPEHGDTEQELLKNSDMAMYAAKSAGRDTVRTFAPALAKAALQALDRESELRMALDRRELALYFQPVLSESGRLVSAEALLRWKHPREGLLGAGAFIELAESSRAIAHIGYWVLEEALRQAKLWTAVGWLSARVAVNLSGIEFRNPQFIPTLEDLLRKFGLSGRALEVELTERIVMSDELGVYTTLEVLKSLGVTIAIDDFGTGFSSFARLRELPVDRIKIAAEFVQDLHESTACRAIVHSIAELARGLGLSLVAEGVEHAAQLEVLQLLGCREVQGFFFSPPMSSAEFGRWLRTNPMRWKPLAQPA